GKILELDMAKEQVVAALDDKATNRQALRNYIDFKKEKLESDVTVETTTIDEANSPFPAEFFAEISALDTTSPFMKPRKVGDSYITVKLQQIHPAKPKSFEEAKAAAAADYTSEQSAQKLQELASSSLSDFKGTHSGYITSAQSTALSGLNEDETKFFVSKLFTSTTKRGFVPLSENKLLLFNITEQKLVAGKQDAKAMEVARLKTSIFDQSLIKMLENKFTVESFIGDR
ncbi:MAG: peptidylprolyl isomerase, partial [Thiovulaceae bacterium]|nr:peptidylprolyl isomerase [Sulfurimonadaceae bacterium]